VFGNAEESDRDLPISFGAHITSQSLCPRETIMGTFGTGKWCESDGWSGIPRFDLNLHALMVQQVDTGTSMHSALPIMPEDRSRANCHWMRASRSPNEVLSLHHHSIGTAHAGDRDGNCGDFPHTPRADCHQLLGVAHGQ
jgi:hypothetical protein